MCKKPYELHFDAPITHWEEALPLGSGLVGALLYGSSPLRLSLDRSDLWDLRPAPHTLRDDYTYKELIRLAREKKRNEANERFSTFYHTEPNPTKIPAGALEFSFPTDPAAISYHLDLRTAVATVGFKAGGKEGSLIAFLSRETDLCYLLFQGESHETPRLIAPNYQREPQEQMDSLSRLGYPPAQMTTKDHLIYFVQQTAEQTSYAILVGSRTVQNGTLYICSVAASQDGEHWLESAKKRVDDALKNGWDSAYASHKEQWEAYHELSRIELPKEDFALEHHWFLNNYLFASTSRDDCPPLALQGVWTADNGHIPPWKGDYHYDLNVQLSYSHYLMANRLNEGKSIVSYLLSLAPSGRRFAREFYGCEGLTLPSVSDLAGRPMGGWPQYCYSPTNHLWTCQLLADYFDYTQDLELLKEKIYPYLKESAGVPLHLLKKDKNGFLKLPVSTSPEYHDDRQSAWFHSNTNYDTSLMRAHFLTLARLAKLLHNGEEAMWKTYADQLPPLSQNRRGALNIAKGQPYRSSHRHQSHAMAIYPLGLLRYDTPENRRAINATLRRTEKKGTSRWNGYTYPWVSCLYSMKGDGTQAREMLREFTGRYISPNGFHLNTNNLTPMEHRPFTLEGNFAYNDALQQMLLQNGEDCVELFPAVPAHWREQGVAFHNLRAKGGLLLSAAMEDQKLSSLAITAPKDVTIRLRVNGSVHTISLKQGKNNVTLP